MPQSLWIALGLAWLAGLSLSVPKVVRAAGRLPALVRCQRGTATVEFALVMPIAMFVVLILLQITLLMVGNIYVHYAAYAATRTAITQIPADYTWRGGEPGNIFDDRDDGIKKQAIHHAAAFAVMPVSGRLSSGPQIAEQFADGLRSFFTAHGASPPRWVDTLAADRMRYALTHTEVTVLITEALDEAATVTFLPVIGSHQFGPVDPITVRVEHRFFLSIPYVRAIFADGELPGSTGSGQYATMAAHYTLTNEGVATNLPPRPALPRNP